ncbi:hypothetical protein CEXT_313011 [Caerostris extrusa]|uniref:Uncharacterized protein n=1 Tax=Caerostris extrusa TaxID=172846 RepID=A0AAV4MAK8_CAEEX|nr:hypothetical protein CEXT_313011 [Caerostris extrusa]
MWLNLGKGLSWTKCTLLVSKNTWISKCSNILWSNISGYLNITTVMLLQFDSRLSKMNGVCDLLLLTAANSLLVVAIRLKVVEDEQRSWVLLLLTAANSLLVVAVRLKVVEDERRLCDLLLLTAANSLLVSFFLRCNCQNLVASRRLGHS